MSLDEGLKRIASFIKEAEKKHELSLEERRIVQWPLVALTANSADRAIIIRDFIPEDSEMKISPIKR